MPASSDKEQQNQAATTQIQQNKTGALTSLQDYLAQHPGPLAGAAPPQAPQQYGGMNAGQNFGGPMGPGGTPMTFPGGAQPGATEHHLRRALQMQQPPQSQQGTFQGQPQPGGSQMPGQMPPQQQIPAGLLGLLQNPPPAQMRRPM